MHSKELLNKRRRQFISLRRQQQLSGTIELLEPRTLLSATLVGSFDLIVAAPTSESGLASLAITNAAPSKKIGGLDPTFGNGGFASHNVGMDHTTGVLIQGDGKVLIVGTDGDPGNEEIAITRYNADGSVDTSFAGGIVHTPIGHDAKSVQGFLLPDGNIVIAGTATAFTAGAAAGSQFFVAQYTSTGAMDTSFGNGTGYILASFSNVVGTLTDDVAQAMTVSSSGEIFVAGSSDAAGHGLDFALAAFNPDGTPVSSFGIGGRMMQDIADGDDSIASMALQPNGEIVVAGSSDNPSTGVGSVAMASFFANGALDTHFGVKGKTTTSVRGVDDAASSLAIDSKGRVVVGGFSATGSDAAGTLSPDFLLLRYGRNGKLDHSFGHGGFTITTFNQPAAISRVLVGADGSITASGKTTATLNGVDDEALDLALARYTANGLPDLSFNGIGQVILNLASAPATSSLGGLDNPLQQPADVNASAINTLDASATLMQEFQSFRQAAEGAIAMDSGGELVAVGNSNGNTIAATIVTMGEDLAAVLVANVPHAIVGGAKGTATVAVTENGNVTTSGTVIIELSISLGDTSTAGFTAFTSFPEPLKLKPGQARQFHLRFSFPSSSPDASDFLVATVDTGDVEDLNPADNTAANAAAVVIARPFVDLSGRGLTAPVFPTAKPVIISFDITNNGNIPTTVLSAVQFLASTDGTLANAVPLTTLPLRFNLKSGASKAYRFKLILPTTLPAGTYQLLALLDPENALSDPNPGNNLVVSQNVFSIA